MISIIYSRGFPYAFFARDPICIFQGSNYFYGWESSVNNILEFISETKQRMEMTANYDRYS